MEIIKIYTDILNIYIHKMCFIYTYLRNIERIEGLKVLFLSIYKNLNLQW